MSSKTINYAIVVGDTVTQTGQSPAHLMHMVKTAPGERLVANVSKQIGDKLELPKVKTLGQTLAELTDRVTKLESELAKLRER